MKNHRQQMADIFASLGDRLQGFGGEDCTRRIIELAQKENRWFTPADIASAVKALCSEMLNRSKLERWLEQYRPCTTRRNVGVIMAGNIPLVGFFDMMCVLASGHNCYYKPSSKDSALMSYIVKQLQDIYPQIGLYEYSEKELDAIIATGSNNARRLFNFTFSHIPSLLRGSRSSVAVIDGSETEEELQMLGKDIFSYSGLGCRNVSHMLLPEGYDTIKLMAALSQFGSPSKKYFNNYRQRKALLELNGYDFEDGGFFVLTRSDNFSSFISEITYREYSDANSLNHILASLHDSIQCVVGKETEHYDTVAFGKAQSPSLYDYADGIDTMRFLTSL